MITLNETMEPVTCGERLELMQLRKRVAVLLQVDRELNNLKVVNHTLIRQIEDLKAESRTVLGAGGGPIVASFVEAKQVIKQLTDILKEKNTEIADLKAKNARHVNPYTGTLGAGNPPLQRVPGYERVTGYPGDFSAGEFRTFVPATKDDPLGQRGYVTDTCDPSFGTDAQRGMLMRDEPNPFYDEPVKVTAPKTVKVVNKSYAAHVRALRPFG